MFLRRYGARACSALARIIALPQVSSLPRGTDTVFIHCDDGRAGLTSMPASLLFAKRYTALLHPSSNCLCRDVLEAATHRCSSSRAVHHGEANTYSMFGCVLVGDVMDAVSSTHMKFGQSHWIDGDDTVMNAVRQMFSTNLSALVVMERDALDADRSGTITDDELLLSAENNAIVGIVTERDYLNAVAKGNVGVATKVKEIMTDFKNTTPTGEARKKLIFTSPSSTALGAIETMTNNRLRHIPVIGSKGFDEVGNPIEPRVLGVVAIGELLKGVLAEARQEIHQLECYIHGDSEYSAEEHVSGHSNDKSAA